MPCIKNTIKRINAFSIIELLIIISIISGLVIVAAPSFYGIFKQQFLVYNTHQLIQELRGIQSNAFIKHSYYKIEFNATEKKYTIWKSNQTNWQKESSTTFENHVDLNYTNILSDTNHIMYGPNGRAYACNQDQTAQECQSTPLSSTAKITLKTEKKSLLLNFYQLMALLAQMLV